MTQAIPYDLSGAPIERALLERFEQEPIARRVATDGTIFIDFAPLPLSAFPRFDDAIVLVISTDDTLGYHLRFASPRVGTLASFPWWDHVDRMLAASDFAIPMGTLDEPFHDLEQSWDIGIAREGALVYVVEGAWDVEPERFTSYFAMDYGAYIAAWQTAIDAARKARATTSADRPR